mmetsp:Transcript_23668/g.35100  ORF Transcript_23668/g.35100 Transcript_23668/m.35100 type:complete len:119 (+) Transcript_23668:36-392(+)
MQEASKRKAQAQQYAITLFNGQHRNPTSRLADPSTFELYCTPNLTIFIMTIVYALISRQKTVLAEFTATLGKSEEKNTTPIEAETRSRLLVQYDSLCCLQNITAQPLWYDSVDRLFLY